MSWILKHCEGITIATLIIIPLFVLLAAAYLWKEIIELDEEIERTR